MRRYSPVGTRYARPRRHPERGGIMVQALIVLAGLVTLVAMMAANQRAALQGTQNRMDSRRAEFAARSAVQRALAILGQQTPGVLGQQASTTGTTGTTNPALVMQTDYWYTLGSSGDEAFDLGNGTTFRMQIVDAGAFININTVGQQQLQMLPLTQEQMDSLLDWRSPGQTARTDGAKDAYYNALDQPYNTKLGALTTLSELLLVKGWTAETLYGTQHDGIVSTAISLEDANGNPLPLVSVLTTDSGAPNRQATGQARVNLNQRNPNSAALQQFTSSLQRLGLTAAQASQITSRMPIGSFQALLTLPGIAPTEQRQLLNGAGFSGATRLQGMINLNTASQAVLDTIPNVTPEIASAIVAQQSTGFQSLGDLTMIPGVAGNVLPRIADAVTVGSDTWIVRAYGECGGSGVAVEASVGIRNNQPQIVTYRRLPDTGIPVW